MHFSPEPMHIPDGFLSVLVSASLWIASVVVIGYALKRVEKDLGERQVPLMGVLAACVFAGQMLNFTIIGGTSGHLMGAALCTILLGPWASILIMTCVVSVQALLFQDGGLLALGANIFNMGILGTAVSYAIYRLLQQGVGKQRWGLFASGAGAAWASIVVVSLAVALQLAVSGTAPANLAIPAMGGIHALIGIGEALITVGAMAFLYATRRDLLNMGSAHPTGGRIVAMGGLVLAVLLAIASPLASSDPDGLESVAEQLGFLTTAQAAPFDLIPDYSFPGLEGNAATIVAGIIGLLIVFGVAWIVAYLRRQRQSAA
jgi:cobalt/nickel transport system permease protein